jgi:glycogen synthase
MKILFVSSDVIPHVGGKSTHICDLMDGLNKEGHSTTLVSRTNISSLIQFLFKIMISPIRLINRGLYIFVYIKLLTFLLSLEVTRICKLEKIDVISAQDTIAANACKGVNKKEVPVALTMHTYFGIENTLDNSGIQSHSRVEKLLLTNELKSLDIVKSVIAVDTRIKKHVNKVIRNHFQSKVEIKVNAISNFTNVDKFFPANQEEKIMLRKRYGFSLDSFIVVCARRLVEKNGVIFAIKAMKHLKANSNIHLIVVGDGIQKDNIKEYVKTNELSNSVTMMGNIANEDIRNIYSLADVSIVPSITVNGLQEATSITAIESMACGLPVIASEIGGLCELIDDGKTGFLVHEQNEKVISEKIVFLKDNHSIYTNISLNSVSYITKNHSHKSAAEKYGSVFNDILK